MSADIITPLCFERRSYRLLEIFQLERNQLANFIVIRDYIVLKSID